MKILMVSLPFLLAIALLSTPSGAVTAVVDVSEAMGWRVVSFSAADSTYPDTVYFTLQFQNNGTVDLNVSGNLSIKKDGATVYTAGVFEGNVSQLEYRNFTFEWDPSSSGDFIANLTINTTNQGLGRSNLTFTTTSFTVYSQPSGPGASPSGTYTPETLPQVEKSWDRIEPGVEASMEINKSGLDFTEIRITVKNQANQVSITVTKLGSRPATAEKELEGNVYQYVNIKRSNLEDEEIERSIIRFRVSKAWISGNRISKGTVVLNRYKTEWAKLPTVLLEEDADYVYYEAETRGFSVFAITGEEMVCEPGIKVCSGKDLETCREDGSGWEITETCEHGCDSETRSCRSEFRICDPGERRCEGDILKGCSSDGHAWGIIDFCEFGCSGGGCLEKGAEVSDILSYAGFVLIIVIFIVLWVAGVSMIRTRKESKGFTRPVPSRQAPLTLSFSARPA